MELKIPPPIVAMFCAVMMWLVAQQLPGLDLSLYWHVPRVWRLTPALVLLSAGLLIGLAAVLSFRRHKTTVNPLDPEATRVLVTSGVYRFSRNPMYLGVLLMLTALCIALANLGALVLLVVFVVYIQIFQINPEERVLAKRFGVDFENYCKHVRCWI